MKKILSVILCIVMMSCVLVSVTAETLPSREYTFQDMYSGDDSPYYFDYVDEVTLNNVVYGRKIIVKQDKILNTKEYEANYYTVVKLFDSEEAVKTVEEINIEKEINGIPVLTIENTADYFESSDYLPIVKNIKIPASIKYIGYKSFYKFNQVKELVLPNDLEGFGRFAFSKMTRLEKITIPKKVKTITAYAFLDCKKLNKVKIKGEIKVIEEAAFLGCKNLSNINFPKTLQHIEDSAFYNSNLNKVNVSFKKITSKNNNYNIINPNSFSKNKQLKYVKLSAKRLKVCASAFSKCKNLKSIKLVTKTLKFEKNAFSMVPKTCKVYVKTKAIKKAVVKSGFKGKVIVKKGLK